MRMRRINFIAYRSYLKLYRIMKSVMSKLICSLLFRINKVEYCSDFRTQGLPVIEMKRSGVLAIGHKFSMSNGSKNNMIGRQQRCYFVISGKIIIGDNVGISCSAIVCWNNIIIEDGVNIGGNTVIYDTDFHSLLSNERHRLVEDKNKIVTKPVVIKKNVFIGAHSTILKGVTIGENSIIGACSVITKSIPANQIWAGNPARFIKNIEP